MWYNRYCKEVNFNPLPPCGGRPRKTTKSSARNRFQSTPSVWRETVNRWCRRMHSIFQSTPSVWRETIAPPATIVGVSISIHSLRVEGDCRFYDRCQVCRDISIHSLRVEGDHLETNLIRQSTISIHSLRVEGDRDATRGGSGLRYFNPLPPCGGRPSKCWTAREPYRFQSTPSVWRETAQRHRIRR